MAIYNTISTKYIISKLYRDLGLDDDNYDYDIIEWAGEALDFIGSYSQLSTKNKDIVISDFKGFLPYDFVLLNQLEHVDEGKCKIICYNPKNFIEGECLSKQCPNKTGDKSESFYIDNGYIKTSFEEGEVRISYQAVLTDGDGYPLVPDNQYFKDALFWYCYKKLLLRGHQSKVQTIDYHFADEKWRFYCSAARNKANYPDYEGYRRFRDIWVGLLPNINLEDKGFDTTAKRNIPLETVNASNIVTTPITIDKQT